MDLAGSRTGTSGNMDGAVPEQQPEGILQLIDRLETIVDSAGVRVVIFITFRDKFVFITALMNFLY